MFVSLVHRQQCECIADTLFPPPFDNGKGKVDVGDVALELHGTQEINGLNVAAIPHAHDA